MSIRRPAHWSLAARLCVALSLASCAQPKPPEPAVSAEEQEDFRTTMATSLTSVDGFLAQSKAGGNVSEFAMGWFAMDLLSALSDQDDLLYRRFHRDGQMIATYLKDDFQRNPERDVEEVRALAGMGNSTIRRAAAEVLEALRVLPSGADPVEEQQLDRAKFIDALTGLRARLQELANPAPAPSRSGP